MDEKNIERRFAAAECAVAVMGTAAGIIFYCGTDAGSKDLFGALYVRMIEVAAGTGAFEINSRLIRTFAELALPFLLVYLSAYTVFFIPVSIPVLAYECMRLSCFFCAMFMECPTYYNSALVLSAIASLSLAAVFYLGAFIFESMRFRVNTKKTVFGKETRFEYAAVLKFTEKFLFISGLAAIWLTLFVVYVKIVT